MNVQQKFALVFIRTKLYLLALVNKKRAAREAFRLFCTPVVNKKEKEPYKNAEPLQFILEGKTIRGFRSNHPQPKKVLLLHGFSSSSQNFYSYVAPLVEKGYEVLAFDAPAHGNSEGTTVNAVQYCDMIKKVIQLYGPVHSFIAHSFGGIALMLALEQIPHDKNTRVVLIAPATETTSAIDNAFSVIGIKDLRLRHSIDEIIYDISGRKTEWFSIRRTIRNISASVLWIHDEDDDVTPLADALKVKEDKPGNVQFIITNSLGHRKIYRDEDVKNEIINFL